jgi:hypothetical protein
MVMLLASRGWANSSGPPDERTAAPMEGTCFDMGCHTDAPLGSGPGDLVLIVPPSYVPDEVYVIDVRLSQAGQMRWGFELAALDALGSSVGNLMPLDAETQVTISQGLGRQYVKHTFLGSGGGQPDSYEWSFQWTAPSEDVGPLTFYAAGNAADNNGLQIDPTGQAGDFIYTAQQTVPLPEPSSAALALAAVAALGAIAQARRTGSP